MRKLSVSLLAAAWALVGCDGAATVPGDPGIPAASRSVGHGNDVIHRVSVGSHDFSAPGDNANFSLIAIQHLDGTVSGEFTDQYGHGDGGLHVGVDCLTVQGNRAWVGGVVTQDTATTHIGTRAITEVEDNGTSSNSPPDRISFSFDGLSTFVQCQEFQLPLFPLAGGQVKIE